MLAAMGFITEDQIPALADWITEAETDDDQDFDDPEEWLAAMVSDEVITQKQADSITDFFFPYDGTKPDKDGYRHTEPSDADDADQDKEEGADQDGTDQDEEEGHRQTESSDTDGDDADDEGDEL